MMGSRFILKIYWNNETKRPAPNAPVWAVDVIVNAALATPCRFGVDSIYRICLQWKETQASGDRNMELPQELQTAVGDALASLPVKRLAALAADLSNRYRKGPPAGGGKILQSEEDIAAYAAFRLPATFAAVHSALGQVRGRLPDWVPKTMLDVGAGPGTAMWAAASIWPDLERFTLLEREEGMIALGKRLATYSSLASVRDAKWIHVDLAGNWESSPHDLVIASYVIGELSQDSVETVIRKLWEYTSGILVIIEPGTPAGFSRVQQAREQLLATGEAKTIAPCPHDRPCPMTDDDWCHFAQRVARSRLHRLVKGGELPYEDEKFTFVSLSRQRRDGIRGRVIRHPQVRKGHIYLEICSREGLQSMVVKRKDRELFRKARDLRWGSVMPSDAFDD
jgi:ribosomal protein RSM22 (predicted rRNA methylase)